MFSLGKSRITLRLPNTKHSMEAATGGDALPQRRVSTAGWR